MPSISTKSSRSSSFGILAIVLLLAYNLKSFRRTRRRSVAAGARGIAGHGRIGCARRAAQLLHLVGMLLIVAVGSNYALFSTAVTATGPKSPTAWHQRPCSSCCLPTPPPAIGFGVLAFSTVPVLHALGVTVAPGAILALLLSIVFALNLRVRDGAPD